jgi:hypothetical protein
VKAGGGPALSRKRKGPGTRPQSWFSASRIHLNGGKRADLVVVGNPPLLGANITTFWVFRASEHERELVMTWAAHDLRVQNTSHNGYRDLTLASATAVEVSYFVLHFDGKKYVMV